MDENYLDKIGKVHNIKRLEGESNEAFRPRMRALIDAENAEIECRARNAMQLYLIERERKDG